VKPKYIQIIGTTLTLFYGAFVAFLYLAAPASIAEIPQAARNTIQTVTTTGQVVTGTYEINRAELNLGLADFHNENYVSARLHFDKADPAKRDAAIQFYIADSYYRQGWGRVTNDDAYFKSALDALKIVDSIDKNFRSTDADLKLPTTAELRNELEEGMRVTADDFNPLRIVRERK
jgi:hypothetical protein